MLSWVFFTLGLFCRCGKKKYLGNWLEWNWLGEVQQPEFHRRREQMNIRNLFHLKTHTVLLKEIKNPFNYSEGTRSFKTNQITFLFQFWMSNELQKPSSPLLLRQSDKFPPHTQPDKSTGPSTSLSVSLFLASAIQKGITQTWTQVMEEKRPMDWENSWSPCKSLWFWSRKNAAGQGRQTERRVGERNP